MKALRIILIHCICLQNAFCQFNDGFDDGDFSHNPTWHGDTSYFTINPHGELQSQGPTFSSEIYLSTDYNMSQSSIWQFHARLHFATSSSNYARFYLSSDNSDLSTDLNGYYVKLGGESGADDGIDLYIQEGSDHNKIIDGISGFFGRDSNEVSIKVTRTKGGEWSLWADTSGVSNQILQGSVNNNTLSLNNSLGVFCKHSATRNDKFHFDSISLRDGPFTISDCIALNDSVLKVGFSNPIDTTTALNTSNYIISNSNLNPKSIYAFDSLPYEVFLHLNSKLSAGNYSLFVSNIKDRQNQILYDSTHFSYYPSPQSNHLVINEFMYDPSPIVGLPMAEYVEILSIASETININEILYGDSNTEVRFPDILLDSGEYLILCDIKDTTEFKWFGNVLGLENWPTLNNSGDIIRLLTSSGQILDQIVYNEDWSAGSPKGEGGWAFERINPSKKCSDINNWSYSVNGAGGTPGQINSIFDTRPDPNGPELEFVEMISSKYLRLNFDEILDQNQFLLHQIDLSPNNSVESLLISENTIELSLQQTLDSGEVNTLSIDSIYNCEGQHSSIYNFSFGLGRTPQKFDLVINEIMYDPEPQNSLPGSEYIELYNTSSEIISLNSILAISENDSTEFPPISIYPEEYLILSPSSKYEELKKFGKTIKMSPWISLNNDIDEISLIHNSSMLHKINYSSDWISDIYKKDGGWSIEMIDPNNPCGEESNWNASNDQKGGTPGKENSIHANNLDLKPVKIIGLDIETNTSIKVLFNEQVDFSHLHLNNIQIEPAIEVIDFSYSGKLSKNLLLKLSGELKPDIEYKIDLYQITDCVHNYTDLSISFILPETPGPQEIIINEVLFNSSSEVSEFIEIYNRTSKNINLENINLRYYRSDGEIGFNSVLSSKDVILNAYEFLVLCEDSNSIIQNFPRHGHNYLEVSNFPSLNNESGSIVLLDSNQMAIDSMIYSEDYHFELIEDDKGVSLERVSSDISSVKNDNWTSASETFGFGSPGIMNSKSILRRPTKEKITIEPVLFSPDGDGYNDLLHIHFTTDNQSAIASVNIFDQNGSLVKSIANNFTLSYDNDFIWDGISDWGEKARIGNYIILIDLFDLDGNRNKIKKVVGLGGRI